MNLHVAVVIGKDCRVKINFPRIRLKDQLLILSMPLSLVR